MAINTTHRMTLQKDKETKRTYVFKNEEAYITSVYIKKEAFPAGCPKAITLEVNEWELEPSDDTKTA